MNVVFRADSSVQIGTGHIMRCLTIANELRKHDVGIRFVCREYSGNLVEFIEQNGYMVDRLPDIPDSSSIDWWEIDVEQTGDRLRTQKVDWLIIDHYEIDRRWEKRAQRFAPNIMVIDDLANRKHDCDILLDQNLYEKMETRYDGLVPHNCLQLIGPRFALLREEFRKARMMARKRDGQIRRVLVFFGGTDPTNETMKAIQAIQSLSPRDVIVDVVVGQSNPNRKLIAEMCTRMSGLRFHCQINYMEKLMVQADLAIGAGGTTTWERCAVGLPAITVTTAENQIGVIQAVEKNGCVIHLGTHLEVSCEKIANELLKIMRNPNRLALMSENCFKVMGEVESDGVTLVAQAILKGATG